MTSKINRVRAVVKVHVMQNSIQLRAEVRELSCVQRKKNFDENNTVRRYRVDSNKRRSVKGAVACLIGRCVCSVSCVHCVTYVALGGNSRLTIVLDFDSARYDANRKRRARTNSWSFFLRSLLTVVAYRPGYSRNRRLVRGLQVARRTGDQAAFT